MLSSLVSVSKRFLSKAMTNAKMTECLLESGYSEKRQEQVVQRKRKVNEGRSKRAARKREKGPKLLMEVSFQKFHTSMGTAAFASIDKGARKFR